MSNPFVGFDNYGLHNMVAHLIDCEQWEFLIEFLTSFDFLFVKVNREMSYGILSDYEKALAAITDNSKQTLLQAFATAFAQELHIIQSSPSLTAQQLYNNLFAHYGHQGIIGKVLERFANLDEYPGGNTWLRRLNVSPRSGISPALTRTVNGHSKPVAGLSIPLDGKTIVSGGHDGMLAVWQRHDGSLIKQFQAHSNGINALTLHPFMSEHVQVISAGRDQFIRVWDCETGIELFGWRAHADIIRDLTVLLDRQEVVSCGDDRVLIGWNLSTGQEKWRLRGHLSRVFCVASDRSGRRLVSGSEDRTIRVWDLDTEKFQLVNTIRGHMDRVRCVAVSSDGKWAVSGSDDTTAIIWDLDTGQAIHTLSGHRERIRAVAILTSSHDKTSDYIVTGSDDETVRIWEAESGKLRQTLYGHTGGIYSIVTHPGEDDWFTTGGQDGTLRHWNIARSPEKAEAWWEHDARITRIALDSSKTWLASGSEDSTVRLWKTEASTHHSNLRGHLGAITCLAAFSNNRIASGGTDSTIRLWDTRTGGLINIIGHGIFNPDIRPSGSLSSKDILSRNGAIMCLLPLNDQTLLSTAKDGFVRMWDLETGKLKQKFAIPSGVIQTLAFSRSLRVIIGAGTAREINLWDMESGQLLAQLKGHTSSVTCMALIRSNHLATGSQDKIVRIWDLGTHKEVGCLKGHQQSIRCLAVDPANNLIISGSDDGNVRVWDANSQDHVHILSGHTQPVRALMSNPGGHQIYSAGEDQRIILWNIGTETIHASAHVGSNITALALVSPNRICIGTQQGGLAFFELEGVSETEPSKDESLALSNESFGIVSIGTSVQIPIQFSPDIGSMRQNYHAAGDGTRTMYIVQQVYPTSDPEQSLQRSDKSAIPTMDVQENIYKFCKQMIEDEGVHLITVEGADQKLEPFSPPRSIAEIMLLRNDISAAVLCALDEFHSLIDVWGVDAVDIVQPSWKIMEELRQLSEARERVFNKIRELLLKGQSLYYSPDVIQLRSHLKLYAKNLSITDEVIIIRQICKQVELPFSTFPLLNRLYQAQKIEGKIRWELLEKQREDFVRLSGNRILGWRDEAQKQGLDYHKFLRGIVPHWVKHTGQTKTEFDLALEQRGPEQVQREYQYWYRAWILHGAFESRFVRGQMNGAHGQSEYLQELLELAEYIGISSKDLPLDLRLYAKYLKVATIEPEALSDELKECRLMLIDHLNLENAVWLRDIEERADFLYSTLRLENTPVEVEVADFTFDSLQDFLVTLCKGLKEPFPNVLANDIQALDQGVILGSNFSNYSFQRSRHMIRRTLEIMQQSNQDTAIMVIGGFHTRVVIRALEDYPDLNWHVFTPKFDIDFMKKLDPNQGHIIP